MARISVIGSGVVEMIMGKGFKKVNDNVQNRWDTNVYAEKLRPNEIRLDIGTAEAYNMALDRSYEIL